MNIWDHSRLSVRKFGGKEKDYFQIHKFLDSSKLFYNHVKHRILLHNLYGVEIANPDKSPNSPLAIDIFETVRDQGVIMGLGGLHKNVLRVMPPMCVTKQDSKFLKDVLDYSISVYTEKQ